MIEQYLIPFVTTVLVDSVGLRVYPNQAPEGETKKPYCVYLLVSTETEHCQDTPAFRTWTYQFSIYATTYKEAATLRDLMLSSLDGYKGKLVGAPSAVTSFMERCEMEYFTDMKIHGASLDFRITESL